MPFIHRYRCNQCDFELPTGWGTYDYAVTSSGARVEVPHGRESCATAVRKVTGLDYEEARAAGRAGIAHHSVCLGCLQQFGLDLQRDKRRCPHCASAAVKTAWELVGQPCPQCKLGVVESTSPIQWKLDPDWEQLPVRPIVKDLLAFEKTRRPRLSLKRGYKAAQRFGPYAFVVTCLELLEWWEGEFASKKKAQKSCLKMNPRWTWCKALPAILKATPELADLIKITGRTCRFADGVSADERRGIKNYLRKHRVHVLHVTYR